MSANAVLASHRQPRVLACVLCQHRKIKCDRNTPCSNCIKAKITCTPSTPAPTRKRRRPNQDLQERLARCEELLKQYASAPVPAPPAQQHPQRQQLPSSKGAASATSTPNPATPAAAATPGSTADSLQSRKPGTMLVADDGTVRFMDSYVCATVYDELQKMRDIVETDDYEDVSVLGEDLTPENNADLLLHGDVSRSSLVDLQPDPIHIFRLWQIFLDRINPLTKLVHAPSMQPTILDATTNMSAMPHNTQALLFSIFAAAAVAMTPAECLQMFGVSRPALIQRFNAGTKTALIRYNFMKNYNMTSLQALVLYFFSLEGRYDRHAAWVLSGTIIRIAQKMGYHRDGEQLKLSPFETEMRRRIWWHVLMQDSKCAMLTGLNHPGTLGHWDTKPPSNVNDADLSPDSTLPVKERDGPTEMAFCMILYELFRFKLAFEREDDDCNVFEAAVIGQEPEGQPGSPHDGKSIFEKLRKRVDEIDERLDELEKKLVDVTAGNVHVAALSIRPMLTHRSKEMFGPMHEQPEWGTEIFGPRDKFFKVLLMALEHKTSCHETMAAAGFDWFMRFHLQLDLLGVFTTFLQDRPMGSLSQRAWDCMAKLYSCHSDMTDLSVKQHLAQAQLTLKAWKTREAAFARVGQQLSTPAFISQLREMVPMPSQTSALASPAATQQQQQQVQPMLGFDQLFGDYLTSSAKWDTLSEFMWSSNSQLSTAMLDGFGVREDHI